MANLKITPGTVLLAPGQTVTFTATALTRQNDGSEKEGPIAANWYLSPLTGSLVTPPGEPPAAALNAPAPLPPPVNRTTTATYVAPGNLQSAQTVAVVAMTQTDSASASVSLTPNVLSLTPASVDLRAGEKQQFLPLVGAPSDEHDPVKWLIFPQGVGGVSDEGLYTAPPQIGDETAVTISATREGLGATATAKVNLVAPPWRGMGVVLLGAYLFLLFCQVFLMIAIWPLQTVTPEIAKVQRLEAEVNLDQKILQVQEATAPQPAAPGAQGTTGETGATRSGRIAPATGSTQTSNQPAPEPPALTALKNSLSQAQDNVKKKDAQDVTANNPLVSIRFGRQINREIDLLCMVLLAGSLGAFLHLAQSFSDFTGNRTLKNSWVWWYAFRPFVGAALAFLIYAAARGGLLTIASSNGINAADLNAYGLVALSGLAGMFSKAATSKLAEIFELFQSSKAKDTKDKLAGGHDGPPVAAAGGAAQKKS